MPKSLAELQSSPDVGRPERSFQLCVSGKLVADFEAADRDFWAALQEQETANNDLETALQAADDQREGAGPPRRVGDRSPVQELKAKATAAASKATAAAATVDAVRARIEDHTITLRLRGKTNGEWRQWVAEHPPRDEDDDKTGAQRDLRIAGGYCNLDDLIAALGDYVEKYGDEPASDAWRTVAFDNAAPGELTQLASLIVAMHEQVVDLGKSRSALLADRRSGTDSE